MFRRRMLLGAALLVASTTWFNGSANAGIVVFPDEMTSTLVYSSIEETNSSIIAGFTLFGGVSTFGENLTFAANNFRNDNQTGGIQVIDGRLSFNVRAKAGYAVVGVRISEVGSAQVFNETSIARATLVGFATPENGPTSAAQQSVYQLTGLPLTVTDEPWDLSIGFAFGATRSVDIDFDNRLFTFATPNRASAYIDKKRVTIEVRTIAIPEPSSALAFAVLGLAGTAIRRRRMV